MSCFLTVDDVRMAYPAAGRAGGARTVLTAAALDVAFDVILHELNRQGVLDLCSLTFKGGTALRKFRIGHRGRFSFDLDFDTPDDPAAVAATIGDALRNGPDYGFGFKMVERRGHHSIEVVSDLLPAGADRVKVDFSARGQCLPVHHVAMLPAPLHAKYPFPADFAVPVAATDENVAEKLSRWRTNPLVRDLYDLAALAPRISDHSRVAAMYVLKSYQQWVAAAPNRRPAAPATELAGTLSEMTPKTFALDDLVLPSAPSHTDKSRMADEWLRRIAGLFDQLDTYVRTESLQRFAADTDGSLAYQARTELEKIGEQARAEIQHPAPPSGAAPAPTFRPSLEFLAAPGRLAGPVMCGQRLRSGASCQRQLLTKPCPKHPSSVGSNKIRGRSAAM